MRNSSLLILVLLTGYSCHVEHGAKHELPAVLKYCNWVSISIYNSYLPDYMYVLTDTAKIEVLELSISSANEKQVSACKPAGQMTFKKDDQVLLTTDFSISSYLDCNYVKYSLNGTKYNSTLTSQAALLLQKIQKAAKEPTHPYPND